jgi:hypothetical protein
MDVTDGHVTHSGIAEGVNDRIHALLAQIDLDLLHFRVS